jgi:hypothetical protein
MQLRSMLLLAAAGCAAGGAARAQDANAQAPGSVIKAETRVVLVDAVVTDKKGNYVQDLEQKDFRVWEDNKEQAVTSFSFEANPNSPNNNQQHYMVLLFDNATMDFGDQARARQAAAQFIDANAGPNRLMASSSRRFRPMSPFRWHPRACRIWAGPKLRLVCGTSCWPCAAWPSFWPPYPDEKWWCS